MAPTIPERFDREARRLGALFPAGPRLVVIGSTDFWHRDSERTCTHVGRLLTDIPDLVLITGGVEGIGEATGRSFFQAAGSCFSRSFQDRRTGRSSPCST